MQLEEHAHEEVQLSVHAVPGAGVEPRTRFIPPNLPHSASWPAGTDVTVLLLSSDLLTRAADELHVNRFYTFGGELFLNDSLVAQLARKLRRDCRGEALVSRLFIESAGYVLAEHILQYYARTSAERLPSDGLTAAQLSTLQEFVDSHLSTGFTVEEMAGVVSVPVNEFRKRLTKTVHAGPVKYVQARRIWAAQRLLRASSLSLGQIALELGYSSQSHFTSDFRSATSRTPGTYRLDSR
jgi:AraC family transcriptional regulator